MEVHFKNPNEIHTLVCDALTDKLDIYLIEYSQSKSLRDKFKTAAKYVQLHCDTWACQDCFSNDYGLFETEVCCYECGTIDEHCDLWVNHIQQKKWALSYAAWGNYEFRSQIKRVDKFELLLLHMDFEMKNQMKRDFVKLEQKFNSNRDKIDRKYFFTNRIIMQRLLEHHNLAQTHKLTVGQRKHYKQFDQLNWPI